MIERQRSPRIALAGLHQHVGLLQGNSKEFLLHHSPVPFVTVSGTHIIQVLVGQLVGRLPLLTALYEVHHARGIAVVDGTEYAERSQFASLLGTDAALYQLPLLCQRALAHEVGIALSGRRHLNGLSDELQARVGNIAQLSADLHHHIDTRTAQLGSRH